MIEPQELEGVDRGYFDIVEARDYIVVLHSKNTCHDWCLLERVANGHRSFLISHRHGPSKPYHPQHKSRPSISECCDYIKDHDAFHLRKMQAKEARRRRRILAKRREKEGIVPL